LGSGGRAPHILKTSALIKLSGKLNNTSSALTPGTLCIGCRMGLRVDIEAVSKRKDISFSLPGKKPRSFGPESTHYTAERNALALIYLKPLNRLICVCF